MGYLPKRGDFNHEYDEDADHLISDLDFQYYSDDNTNEIKFKDDAINLYNARVSERIRRKQFVIERGVLDLKRSFKGAEKKKTKEEKEIFNAFKIFARFNTPEAHERMVNCLIKERRIREVIDQLKRFSRLGIKSLD